MANIPSRGCARTGGTFLKLKSPHVAQGAVGVPEGGGAAGGEGSTPGKGASVSPGRVLTELGSVGIDGAAGACASAELVPVAIPSAAMRPRSQFFEVSNGIPFRSEGQRHPADDTTLVLRYRESEALHCDYPQIRRIKRFDLVEPIGIVVLIGPITIRCTYSRRVVSRVCPLIEHSV